MYIGCYRKYLRGIPSKKKKPFLCFSFCTTTVHLVTKCNYGIFFLGTSVAQNPKSKSEFQDPEPREFSFFNWRLFRNLIILIILRILLSRN
jgi:hypothetical protein